MLKKSVKQTVKIANEFLVYTRGVFGKEPITKYVIFGQGRTGSKLLCKLLDCHPDIYADTEILYNPKAFLFTYVNAKARMSRPETCYGFKVKAYQLVRKHNIDPTHFLGQLHQNGWKIIYLKRNNYLRHAISNMVAKERQQFHCTQASKKNTLVRINCQKLLDAMNERKRWQMEEIKVLKNLNLSYEQVEYESDLLNSLEHSNTANRIFQFLGMEKIDNISTSMTRSTENSLESFVSNVDEVRAFVLGTEFDYLVE